MRLVPILALALLTACTSAPANLEQLLKTCQQKTQHNFTYGPETATVLREHEFRLEGSDPRTPEAWMEVLRGALGAQGLELERIGPAHIDVWLVRQKKG
jgi:hypothetical protein